MIKIVKNSIGCNVMYCNVTQTGTDPGCDTGQDTKHFTDNGRHRNWLHIIHERLVGGK